jgi:hypothetical protein
MNIKSIAITVLAVVAGLYIDRTFLQPRGL